MAKKKKPVEPASQPEQTPEPTKAGTRSTSKPGQNKFTKTDREKAILQIAAMDRQGFNQFDIADAVGITQGMVCYYLKKIKERYAEASSLEREHKVREKLDQYRELRKEAWAAWKRSALDGERTSITEEMEEPEKHKPEDTTGLEKVLINGRYRTVKRQHTKEGRLPSNEYLKTIALCLQAERELEGLDAPKKIAPTKPDGSELPSTPVIHINWNELYSRSTETNSGSVQEGEQEPVKVLDIEEEIKKVHRTNGHTHHAGT